MHFSTSPSLTLLYLVTTPFSKDSIVQASVSLHLEVVPELVGGTSASRRFLFVIRVTGCMFRTARITMCMGLTPRARILRAIILLGSHFRLFFLLLCGLGRALGFWDWVQKGLFSVGYFLSILILIHHAWIFRFCLSTLSCVCHLSALLGFFVLAKASHTMIPSRFRVLLCFALVVKMGDGRW